MTSTAHSSRHPISKPLRNLLIAAIAVSALMMALPGQARQSDRSKPVEVTANAFDGQASPNGVSHLNGNVVITQGTLKATSDNATVYFDADSHIKRIVLKGKPAHLQQLDDNGNLVKGHGNTVDYDIPSGVAKLIGDAYIKQVGRGTARGKTLTYNTTTSVMSAKSGNDNRVHITFLPASQGTKAASNDKKN